MKSILIFALSLLLFSALQAQDIDSEKMSRDIEIAENILIKLTQQQMNTDAWQDDVEGKYIEGYGIVFTVRTMVESYAIGLGKGQFYVRDGRVSIKGGRGLTFMEKDDVKEEQIDRMDIINNTAINFLSDYAFLIRQLQTDDKILLNFVDDWEEAAVINPFPGNRTSQRRTATLTAEVKYKDINSLRTRKISKDAFIERILFSEDSKEEANDPDIELLITIINRVYDEDLTETFVINDSGRYSNIRGLGAIVDLDVDYPHDDDGIIIWTGNDRLINRYRYESRREAQEELEEEHKEEEDCNCPDKDKNKEAFSKLYDPFISSFKENLVEYGQTIKSLEEDEMLMFRLHFNDFDVDYVVDVSVEQFILEQYATGEISLEKAVGKVKVKKNEQENDWRK